MEVARKLDKERALNKKSNLYSIPVIVMVGYDEKDTMTEKTKDKDRIDKVVFRKVLDEKIRQ